jgi:hypothetical protein
MVVELVITWPSLEIAGMPMVMAWCRQGRHRLAALDVERELAASALSTAPWI